MTDKSEDDLRFDRESLSNELLKDYVEEDFEGNGGFLSWPKVRIILMIAIIAMVGLGVFAYRVEYLDQKQINQADIPLVRADASLVRVKPRDPGGMVIANQDKMVYGHISTSYHNKEELPKVTHILPRTEEPINREALQAIQNGVVPATSPVDQAATDQEAMDEDALLAEVQHGAQEVAAEDRATHETVEEQPVKIQSQLAPVAMEATMAPVAVEEVVPSEAKQVAVVEEVAPAEIEPENSEMKKLSTEDLKKKPLFIRTAKTLTMPLSDTSYRFQIQLGSFRNEKEIDKNWQIIQEKHKDLLARLDYHSEKADLGDKGIFYRLKVGPFKDEASARELCQELNERNQGCFFVK